MNLTPSPPTGRSTGSSATSTKIGWSMGQLTDIMLSGFHSKTRFVKQTPTIAFSDKTVQCKLIKLNVDNFRYQLVAGAIQPKHGKGLGVCGYDVWY